MRNSLFVVPALLAAAVLLVLASPAADAARRPASRAAAKAIKRVALRACGSPPGGCRYLGARVSTRNARYAWADVVGEGFSGVLLKRPSARSHRFSVIGTQGGGIGSCAYWRARAPRPVLRDLRVSGLLDASTGATGRCG
ncbi:hypothetical protein Cwoe_0369 [Conexibacter woesei DSM 14684]|uniref:Uncharacterized protein n=1 Tax=Conexibacter woesei (strain DSM 14684 / CCUG 47730 / CIP 108061 / JCM 11494 / NBRC 100937 / ID131577) TaxID=469383 RepID=D3F734_CONWI|nr:hypothetical protein Cwoe_0369 [Conexibacter woesei DSM 14684]